MADSGIKKNALEELNTGQLLNHNHNELIQMFKEFTFEKLKDKTIGST
jgi:hypothetical protein